MSACPTGLSGSIMRLFPKNIEANCEYITLDEEWLELEINRIAFQLWDSFLEERRIDRFHYILGSQLSLFVEGTFDETTS